MPETATESICGELELQRRQERAGGESGSQVAMATGRCAAHTLEAINMAVGEGRVRAIMYSVRGQQVHGAIRADFTEFVVSGPGVRRGIDVVVRPADALVCKSHGASIDEGARCYLPSV